MSKLLSILLAAGVSLWSAHAIADGAAPVAKKTAKTPAAKKPTAEASRASDDEEDVKESDTSDSTVSEFHCELGNHVTVYRNAADEKHIALRWLKRIHRLARVDTSTGADRFENRKVGLVWIGIPAKSILLDSKGGHQLANECKTAEQMTPKKEAAPEIPARAAAVNG